MTSIPTHIINQNQGKGKVILKQNLSENFPTTLFPYNSSSHPNKKSLTPTLRQQNI